MVNVGTRAQLPLFQHQPRLLFDEEVSFLSGEALPLLTTTDSVSQQTPLFPLFCSSERQIMKAEGGQQGAVMDGETGNILSSQSKALTTTSNLEGLPPVPPDSPEFSHQGWPEPKARRFIHPSYKDLWLPWTVRASITLPLSESI